MKRTLPKQIFVTGIGTGVGKTIVSAVLVEALNSDYWKPVQCGNLENSDTQLVKSLISNSISKIHPEVYPFKTAASPHYAAKQEKTEIELSKLVLPSSVNRLIIEGAGGLMVPLNKESLVIDYIQQLSIPVILVSKNYLGSINHTLMSAALLKSRKIELLGIIFNGKNYFDNEEIIRHFSDVPFTGRIDEAEKIDTSFIQQQSEKLRNLLSNYFEL